MGEREALSKPVTPPIHVDYNATTSVAAEVLDDRLR
jgi:hypothetical protein